MSSSAKFARTSRTDKEIYRADIWSNMCVGGKSSFIRCDNRSKHSPHA